LHDVSDLAAQLDRIDGGDISVVDEYSSFRWINHPIDHPQQGRLATPRRPQEDHQVV